MSAGTTPTRKVNTSPPISVPDQQAAKDRAKKDVAEVKQIEKSQKKQAEEDKRVAENAVAPKPKLPTGASARGAILRARSNCATQSTPRGDDRSDAKKRAVKSEPARSGIAEGVSAIVFRNVRRAAR